MLVRSIFIQSVTTSYSFCGYNSLYGVDHLKYYDSQYRMCASVIRSLRCCPHLGEDFEQMIETIACD